MPNKNHRYNLISMKSYFLLFALCCFSLGSFAQSDTLEAQDSTLYCFVKTDGSELFGKIISQDPREFLILTEDNRKIIIPQHVVLRFFAVNAKEVIRERQLKEEDPFAKRYFLFSNALPVRKGEHYVQWNLLGPNLHFGIGDNLSAGVATTWLGVPIVGSIKKSWELNKRSQFAVGAIVGTGSYAAIESGGAMPFATLSFGDSKSNISFTAGYASFWSNSGNGGVSIASIAAMKRVSEKISLVFDSFILPANGDINSIALIIPGIRWHQSEGKAFQFGFAGLMLDGEVLPLPIPTLQWYRRL